MTLRHLCYPTRTDAKWHEGPVSHFHGDNMGSNPIGDTKFVFPSRTSCNIVKARSLGRFQIPRWYTSRR